MIPECLCNEVYEETNNCSSPSSRTYIRSLSELNDFDQEISRLKCKVVNLTREQIQKSRKNQNQILYELKDDSYEFETCNEDQDEDQCEEVEPRPCCCKIPPEAAEEIGETPADEVRSKRNVTDPPEKKDDDDFPEIGLRMGDGLFEPEARGIDASTGPDNEDKSTTTDDPPTNDDPASPVTATESDPTSQNEPSYAKKIYDELLTYKPKPIVISFLLIMMTLLAILFFALVAVGTSLCDTGAFCIPITFGFVYARPRVY